MSLVSGWGRFRNWTGSQSRLQRLWAGGSHPKKQGEVAALVETRDLRGRGGRWTPVPRVNESRYVGTYSLETNHKLALVYMNMAVNRNSSPCTGILSYSCPGLVETLHTNVLLYSMCLPERRLYPHPCTSTLHIYSSICLSHFNQILA